MLKIKVIFILIFLITQASFAQNFKYKSQLSPVNKNEFYKIEVSPEVVARSKYFLADLRIIGEDGTEIPYIINNEVASFYEQDFNVYPIIENSSKGNTQTIVIDNSSMQAINNLVVEMSNAEGEKKIRISGSNDRKNWFMVHQGFTFEIPSDENSTKIYKALNFPMSDYKWFSIAIADTMPLSLNILRIGNYTQKKFFGNYSKLSNVNFKQKDSSDKKSYLNISLNEPNLMDKLTLLISKPEQYLRNTKAYIKYSSDKSLPNFPTVTHTLNSDFENSFSINSQAKISNILLIIDNNDNQALKIDSISLLQLKTYLLAKLESGKKYFIQFGDSTLESPDYDLKYFENKIPHNIAILVHQSIETNPRAKESALKIKSNNALFIWIGLGVVGLLLAFMSYKMLKEVKKT